MDTITPHDIIGMTSLSIGSRIINLGYEDYSVLRELLGWGETISDQHPRVQQTFKALSGVN